MKVSLIQLLHASLVARHGSFSEAARRCNASQPTVSNNVSDLEELLGKKLFLRTTRKVELSPFGRALLPSIEEALAAAHRVTAEAEALLNPEKKLLRIAYTPLLDIGRINALCAAYRQSNPDVEIVFKECAHDSLEDRLMSEQVDVACAHDIAKRREFARCKMFKDPLHYIPANGATEGATEMIPLDRVAPKHAAVDSGHLWSRAHYAQVAFRSAAGREHLRWSRNDTFWIARMGTAGAGRRNSSSDADQRGLGKVSESCNRRQSLIAGV